LNAAKSFEDLIVWQKAHQLTLVVYGMTKGFPREEIFGLSSQMRRAAVSVPSNIAEGFQRSGTKDKIKFFNISQGSLEELRYQLILTRDLQYADTAPAMWLATEVAKLLNAYIRSLHSNS